MRILSIQSSIINTFKSTKPNDKYYQAHSLLLNNTQNKDVFVKRNQSVLNPINFQAGVIFKNYEFEHKFGRAFFRKLVQCGVHDPYDGKKIIPTTDIDYLKNLGVLNKKSPIAIQFLKDYKESLYPIEQAVFSILEKSARKNPNKNIQELLQLKYDKAEQVLINKQSKVLNKINMILRNLSRGEYFASRSLINGAFDKIFAKNCKPEERFSRKIFLGELRELPITDTKVKEKIYEIASTLPTSENSVEAFIVKYSQPEKIIITKKTGRSKMTQRTSEDIGIRLLRPSLYSDDHIYPQQKYRLEELARQNGENWAKDLSQQRITIPSTCKMNGVKGDTLLDDFIWFKNDEPVKYIQMAIDDYIHIAKKWYNDGKYKDAALLVDYIELLQAEFSRRSDIIKIDLSEHKGLFTRIKNADLMYEENIKQRRLKKCGHADNSHKEPYFDKNGNQLQNRKVLKHGKKPNK